MKKEFELIEKLDSIASKQPSKWHEESDSRLRNKKTFSYSQQVAVRILRTLREKGLKQKDLADILKVAPQTVNKWVKGSENFTLDTITKIEAALGIKLISIIGVNYKTFKVDVSNIEVTSPSKVQAKRSVVKVIPLNKDVDWSKSCNTNHLAI